MLEDEPIKRRKLETLIQNPIFIAGSGSITARQGILARFPHFGNGSFNVVLGAIVHKQSHPHIFRPQDGRVSKGTKFVYIFSQAEKFGQLVT